MKLGRILETSPPAGDAASKCVWMTAGMVTYKLCDRHFQCDGCPLDAELRHASAQSPGEPPAPADDHHVSVGQDGALLFFAPNHVWVRVDGSDAVVLGLDDFLLRLLSDVKRFILPTHDTYILRGDSMAIVVRDENSFVINSPISGRVTKRNTELLRHPEAALDQPVRQSWLLQFDPTNLFGEMNALFTGSRALAWQQQEAAKLELILGTLPREKIAQLGPIMHDGKARLGALARLIGQDSYYFIVNSFLNPET